MSDGKEAKEKLRFRINGRSIVYDGYPSARVKDLVDILAKMGIEDDKLVSTFRENIPESSLTDAQVAESYAEAKRLRREKKSKKGDEGGLETPSQSGEFAPPSAGAGSAGAPAPAAPEQVQRITLHFKGRQYTYDGLPSKKEAALVQLLLKHIDTTPEDIVKTYRENIADHNKYTDAEILAFADDAKKRKGSKSSGSSGAGSSTSSAPPGESGASPRPAGASQDSQPRSSSAANTQLSAIDEISSMSSQERDSINSFINSVLLSQNPATAVAAATRPVVPVAAAAPAGDSNAAEADGHRASQSSADVPKIAVYCQEEGQTTQRVIYCPKHASFADLASLVEKKFGRKMVLSFYEGDDKIEIDDDDVVQLFFELQQDGRKLRLICSLPESRRKVTEDKLTESAAQQQAASTSSGAAAGGGQKSGSNLVTPPAASSSATKEFNSSGVISAKEVKSFSGHSAAVYCCSFSPKGDKFCSASRDHSVRVWNIATGAMTVMKGGHNGFVLSCDFSPNGNNIVSSADDTSIKIWNVSTAQKSISLKGHDDKVYCVQYNSTGAYIVSGSCDRTVRVWNADSGAKQVTLKGHDLAVFSCCFSNTDAGRFVASGSDDRLVKVWDWREGREVKNLIGHTGTVWSVKFSHHDKYIVSASMDHELKLWDVAGAACIRTMTGHMTPIHHAIFTPNDRYILSCARDWTVMVWDTETGKHVDTIQSHRNTVYHLDMLGEQVLTSSLDDTVKLWTFQELTKQVS